MKREPWHPCPKLLPKHNLLWVSAWFCTDKHPAEHNEAAWYIWLWFQFALWTSKCSLAFLKKYSELLHYSDWILVNYLCFHSLQLIANIFSLDKKMDSEHFFSFKKRAYRLIYTVSCLYLKLYGFCPHLLKFFLSSLEITDY